MEDEEYKDVISKYNLEPYFKYLLLNNNANTAPYHNLFHTMCVFKSCYNIALDYEKLPFNEIRELLIASLFHDINHTHTKNLDSVNISIAKQTYLSISTDDEETEKKILLLIDSTQYPYLEYESLSKQQQIIRDADMLQVLEDNYIQQILYGYLMTELSMSIQEAIDAQLIFMKNVQFRTSIAKELAEQLLPERIRMIEYLKTLTV